jgi:hypothetical protein
VGQHRMRCRVGTRCQGIPRPQGLEVGTEAFSGEDGDVGDPDGLLAAACGTARRSGEGLS